MESALNPREIQSRIRAGATIDQVAAESGVPAEQVEPFATPVLAERQHQALNALRCPVRRRGETGSNRTLRTVVDERLLAMGVDSDTVEWDAWRTDDRLWLVVGRYTAPATADDRADGQGDDRDDARDDDQQDVAGVHEPRWRFDPRARYSVAVNDEARLLIGEATVAEVPQPRGRLGTPVDHEPTVDLFDERAMLRATQDAAEMTLPLPTGVHLHGGAHPGAASTSGPSPADYTELAARQGNGPREVRTTGEVRTADAVEVEVEVVEVHVASDHTASEPTTSDDTGTSAPLGMPRPQYLRPEQIDLDPEHPAVAEGRPAGRDEDAGEASGAANTPEAAHGGVDQAGYVDTELEQVDGVYDFVPSATTDLDALYDMLQGFNEDSVNIYEGLDRLPPMVEQSGAPTETAAQDPATSAGGAQDHGTQDADVRVGDVELLGLEVTEQNLDAIEAAGTPDAIAATPAHPGETPAPVQDAKTPGGRAAVDSTPRSTAVFGDADVVATGWPGTMGTEREPETGLENPVDHRANDAERAAVAEDASAGSAASQTSEEPSTTRTGAPTPGGASDDAAPVAAVTSPPAAAPDEAPASAAPGPDAPVADAPMADVPATDATATPAGVALGAGTAQPEPPQPETPQPETPQPETPQPEAPRADTPRPETPHPETEETTSIRPRPKRRKRAAVPSWDEIMFGGPGRS